MQLVNVYYQLTRQVFFHFCLWYIIYNWKDDIAVLLRLFFINIQILNPCPIAPFFGLLLLFRNLRAIYMKNILQTEDDFKSHVTFKTLSKTSILANLSHKNVITRKPC